MDNLIILITPSLGIIAIIFAVYHHFKNPQIEGQKNDAVLGERVKWDREATDKKFEDFGKRLDSAFALAQNHVHTVDTKVDSLSTSVMALRDEVIKLSTIMHERLPKK